MDIQRLLIQASNVCAEMVRRLRVSYANAF